MSLFDKYPDLKELNEYSKSVAEEIYADYPEWMDLASCVNQILIITIESPDAPTPRQLIIRTDNDEITVAFDPYYHSHFDCWSCEKHEEFNLILDAKSFSDALMNEEIVIYWKTKDGSHIFGGDVLQRELGDLEVDWTYVVSWRGTFDVHKGEQDT